MYTLYDGEHWEVHRNYAWKCNTTRAPFQATLLRHAHVEYAVNWCIHLGMADICYLELVWIFQDNDGESEQCWVQGPDASWSQNEYWHSQMINLDGFFYAKHWQKRVLWVLVVFLSRSIGRYCILLLFPAHCINSNVKLQLWLRLDCSSSKQDIGSWHWMPVLVHGQVQLAFWKISCAMSYLQWWNVTRMSIGCQSISNSWTWWIQIGQLL